MSFGTFLLFLAALLFFGAAWCEYPENTTLVYVFSALGCLVLSGYKFPVFGKTE